MDLKRNTGTDSEDDTGSNNEMVIVHGIGCKPLEETFYDTVRKRNVDNIVSLVQQNPVDINVAFEGAYVSAEYRSLTALHIACKKGHSALVSKLLEIGANPKVVDKKGETPLHIVCKHGHYACVEILVNFDSRLTNIQNKQGLTPLCKALYRLETPFKEKYYYKTIDLLIQAGCDVNLSPLTNMTPLHLVTQKWCNSTVVSKLIKAGADVNAETIDSSPLMSALCRQRVDKQTVTLLINAGANVNYKNRNGKSVLHVAVSKSEDFCVKQLLDAGADPNVLDSDGNSPLWIAVSENNITITPLLLAHGGDVNFTNKNHMSLLCRAVYNRNKKIARLLLENDIDVDLRTTLGEAAIHYAVLNGDLELITMLLRKNCRLDTILLIPNVWEEQTAFDIATGSKNHSIIKLLLRAGFPYNFINMYNLESDLKDDKEMMDWVLDFIHTPQTLMHLCRVNIRQCYGTDIQRIVNALLENREIPMSLARSILLEDVLDNVTSDLG